jgi:DNA-binding GntR family transcriptional regulator
MKMPAKRALPPAHAEGVRTTSGEQVARYVRRLIFEGSLRPGERVPQDQVAANLGVSRIPVREALIALEREGWVTIEPHRGAFINAIDEAAVHDHYDLYGMIYGFAAQRAVLRGDPDLANRLYKLADSVARSSDELEIGELSVEFHRAVLEGTQNLRIASVLRALSALVPGAFFVQVPGAVDVQKKGLMAIARAFKRRDAERVAAEYQKVMHQVGDKVAELFETRGLFGEP